MRRPRVGVLVILAAASLLASAPAGAQDANGASLPSVTPAQLADMLKVKHFFLVNVLPTYQGEIPQTDAFVSYKETLDRLDLFPPDKSSTVVLYCLTGRSAVIAQKDLLDAGYANVLVLAGGLQAWEREARPVLHRNSPPSTAYPAASPTPGGPVPDPCPCGLAPAKE